MKSVQLVRTGLLLTLVMGWTAAKPARGDGDLKKVKHVVVIMQENHSFDNSRWRMRRVVRTTAGCSVAARKIMIALTG